ncbi:MAG: hypothetical protein J7502_12975 [Flavisolibacter sp.]|nr:hypothetical protein [Flavisolibacter sp.]
MQKLFELFSTREIAFLTWLIIGLLAMTFGADIRKAMVGVLKALFGRKIFSILLLMSLYVTAVVLLLWKVRFWDTYLFKDTVFWFFSFAIVTFFSINKAEDNSFFKSLVGDCFKWMLFIEFFVNFYTFSLTTELIMFPIIVFIALIQAFSKTDNKYELVTKLFTNILALIGTLYFVYALYKTIVEYNVLFTTQNLFSLLLPIILTLALLPFLYSLALYMKYETLFVRVQFMSNNKDKTSKLKRAIFRTAKLNLSKLKTIEKRLNKIDFYRSNDIDEYVRHLVQ